MIHLFNKYYVISDVRISLSSVIDYTPAKSKIHAAYKAEVSTCFFSLLRLNLKQFNCV